MGGQLGASQRASTGKGDCARGGGREAIDSTRRGIPGNSGRGRGRQGCRQTLVSRNREVFEGARRSTPSRKEHGGSHRWNSVGYRSLRSDRRQGRGGFLIDRQGEEFIGRSDPAIEGRGRASGNGHRRSAGNRSIGSHATANGRDQSGSQARGEKPDHHESEE